MPEETFDLASYINEQLAAETAGDPDTSAAPPEQATTDSGTPADTGAQPAGEGTAQQGGQEDPLFDWSQVPPELMAQAKGFQASYTQRMMALAEQRKAFEAEQQQVQGLVQLQRLAAEDPAQAAWVAQQWAAQLSGGVQAGQPQATETDPYTGLEPATPVEELLIQQNREMMQKLSQFEQWQQQQQQAKTWADHETRVNADYQQIKTDIGRDLTEAEVAALAQHCRKIGTQSPLLGFRDLYWSQEINRAKQLGRDEASAVVQQKMTVPGAPSTLQSRAATNPEPPGTPGSRQRLEFYVEQAIAAAE